MDIGTIVAESIFVSGAYGLANTFNNNLNTVPRAASGVAAVTAVFPIALSLFDQASGPEAQITTAIAMAYFAPISVDSAILTLGAQLQGNGPRHNQVRTYD